MVVRLVLIIFVAAMTALSQQMPPIEPGVSHELAKWRAARYSDVRYKLNLSLEKMSPVLKGTIEIRVRVTEPIEKGEPPASAGGPVSAMSSTPIVLDWRRIRGSESLSTISNVSVNGVSVSTSRPPADAGGSPLESNEHLIFRDEVVAGENVIKLDFTSPILTSGSAITRYVDKEDGAEYVYSLFVPSDASTAFPVFDQPDLKARFSLIVDAPSDWSIVSNTDKGPLVPRNTGHIMGLPTFLGVGHVFAETKPISTYVFAFACGSFQRFSERDAGNVTDELISEGKVSKVNGDTFILDSDIRAKTGSYIYVRKSQAAKFKPHAAEVFRLNHEGIKFLESYFDYKFPFPKYDIVLIPEFPFGGMEHAGATFLRESSVIFPQEPTKNDYISRANVIFHEAAHQWFGDTVTMKWFDDLWLKEGFAEFMAYKTLEKVMPEMNAWKVFYERNKQAAYLTDSTKGTTPIYQEIANLNSAKSAYGNIVYRKAPSFLRQAEFYLGPDKFQTAVREFLQKHEYANAGWEDLLKEFEVVGQIRKNEAVSTSKPSGSRVLDDRENIKDWADIWVRRPGMPIIRADSGERPRGDGSGRREKYCCNITQPNDPVWLMQFNTLVRGRDGVNNIVRYEFWAGMWLADEYFRPSMIGSPLPKVDDNPVLFFPNYGDYGYGIFLLDAKSRDYVLKNIGSEKDDFLRTMMWGSLWDSVREGELDPKEYVELVVKNLKLETDESTIQTLLGRVSTAMRYYIDDVGPEVQKPARKQGRNTQPARIALAHARAFATDVENLLIDRMQNAATTGQKITYYRSFLNIASSENARRIMKEILKKSAAAGSEPPASAGGTNATTKPADTKPRSNSPSSVPPAHAGGSDMKVSTKDRFDIVSRLIILGDAEAPKLLADLEKSETSDEAKRYAYAAKAGFATAENKAKFWNDFVANKDISESWIEAAFGPFNNVRHSELTLPYLEKALAELPNLKRNRKIFFVNGWLGAFIGGQKSEQALSVVNKFLADNPNLDKDLRLKILENVDVIERAVKIRAKYK